MGGDTSFFGLTERYPDEASAVRYFEERRWPNGVKCPACKSSDVLRGKQEKRKRQLWYCHNKECETQFSVTSVTVMEFTKLPLRKWLFAFHMIGSSKKGMSARQLGRMLHMTPKTAWHLAHRIRETMTKNDQMFTGIVETDETYIGGKRRGMGRGYRGNKTAVQSILKRNKRCRKDGQIQSIALHGEQVDGRTVGAKLRTHTDPEGTVLMTDDSPIYTRVGENFKDHHTVNHRRKEYAREDPDGHLASTNSVEGAFANMKRQRLYRQHATHLSTTTSPSPAKASRQYEHLLYDEQGRAYSRDSARVRVYSGDVDPRPRSFVRSSDLAWLAAGWDVYRGEAERMDSAERDHRNEGKR